MKISPVKVKYLAFACFMTLLFVSQSYIFAVDKTRVINTKPTANLAISKNKVVDLVVSTDYTGAKLTALQSKLDKLKSDVATNDVDFKYTLKSGADAVSMGGALKEGDPLARGLSGNDSRTKEPYVVKRVDNYAGYYGYFSAYLDTSNNVWASGSNYCVRTSHRPLPNPVPTNGWVNYNTSYEVFPSSYAYYAWVPTEQPYIYKAYYTGLGKVFKDVGTAYGSVITLETNGTVCYHGYYAPAPNEYGGSSPWYFGPSTLATNMDKIWTVADTIFMLGKDGYLYACGDARRGVAGRIAYASYYTYYVYNFPWYYAPHKMENLPKIKDFIISSSYGGFQYQTGPSMYAIDYNKNVWTWGLVDESLGLGIYPNEMAISPGSYPSEPRNDVLTVPTIVPGLNGDNIRSILDGQIATSYTIDSYTGRPILQLEQGLKILKNDGTVWFFNNGVMRRIIVDYALNDSQWYDSSSRSWRHTYTLATIDTSKNVVALKDNGYAMEDGKVITLGRNSDYIDRIITITDGLQKQIDGVWQWVPTPFNWLNTVYGANLNIDTTKLREGSDRMFLWVSDSAGADYSQSYGNYFGLTNLNTTFANTLGTNKFAITAVCPSSTYDYLSGLSTQNLTIRNFVNGSTVEGKLYESGQIDTAIEDLRKKYGMADSSIKNSTLLYVLADEDTVGYTLNYSDPENDPKNAEQWKYVHNSTYFDNPNGQVTYSGQWLSSTVSKFSKFGKYTLTARAQDNPKNNTNFNAYKLWSDESDPATIYVHRRPFALFDTNIGNKAGTVLTLEYLDKSYDLDHNISRADRGIVARSWQYRKVGSVAWLSGKPTSLTYNSGVYEIMLQVKDLEGVWSTPYIDTIDTHNLVPTIIGTPKTFDGFDKVEINITASDNGENDFAYMRYAVTTSTNQPTSAQWVTVPNGIKTKNITINTEGTYYLHMEAYDIAGQVGTNMTGPYIIKVIRASDFYITMIQDIGWRTYYFDVYNGIDDNHDGKTDRYPRRSNTDIDTLKMPINYYNLVSHSQTYIKAGYKVKGKIDIIGNLDWAQFHIKYIKAGVTCTDIITLTKAEGDTYTFDWIIPLETDNKTFISFDLRMSKNNMIYGNEKWYDTWDIRNSSRLVFYVKGKATDDLIFVQSQ